MSETPTLAISLRQVVGKQVKQLRNQGLVPGIIYGPTQQTNVNVQVPWFDLRPVLLHAGGTEMIALQLDGQTINVLVRDVHRHPVRGDVLHIDFYAVDVHTKVRITVPITVLETESTRKRLGANIFPLLSAIEVESLPAEIPPAYRSRSAPDQGSR
ncbi:MAG: 50S ribosomal protein L25 [Anaerolineae bacterium]|nr:50S ribosomal protein L25 [Anaerolineae bacterium]